jgi:phage repressor protein C with HTH and peptisase S24 domain
VLDQIRRPAEQASSLGAFITKRREALGMTQGELGKKVGVRQNTISKIELGGTARPQNWRAMAEVLQVTPVEFMALSNKTSLELGKFTKMVRPSPDDLTRGSLPIMGRKVAGAFDRLVDFETEYGAVQAPPELADVEGAYAVYMNGETMEPRYAAGELLFVHPHKPARRGDFCVIQIADGSNKSGYVVRYISQDAENLHVEQLNPATTMAFPTTSVISTDRIVGMRSF